MRYDQQKAAPARIPIVNPQLRTRDQTEEQRRLQMVKQLSVQASHLDIPTLSLITGFLKRTTSRDTELKIHLSITNKSGRDLYSVMDTIKNGSTMKTKRVNFESQAEVVQTESSTLQYRKINVDRSRQPTAETQTMREDLIHLLESKKYMVRENQNRMAVINGLHVEELMGCDVLHVSDSYGVQGYNGFTTPNHCGVALPGAWLSVVCCAAERLCSRYAKLATVVIAQGGTNDFLRIHSTMLDARRRGQGTMNNEEMASRGVRFATNLTWEISELKAKRPELKFVIMAPLEVHMPTLTKSCERKAELLEVFNKAASTTMKKRHGSKLNPYEVLVIGGTWYLSPDEVHLRPYQTPLVFLRIQEGLKKDMGLENDFIDEPKAVATYYYRGHRTFQRIANVRDPVEREKMIWKNHHEEMRCIKLSMTPKKSKDLDGAQIPTLSQELTLGKSGDAQ